MPPDKFLSPSRMLVCVSEGETWLPLVVKGGIQPTFHAEGEEAAVALDGFRGLPFGLNVIDFNYHCITVETNTPNAHEFDLHEWATDFRHRRPTAKELKRLHGPGDPVKRIWKLWSDIPEWHAWRDKDGA